MDSLYSDAHRALQAEFGTETLAGFLDRHHVHAGITQDEKAFIEGRDMFFLSTVDPEGNPTVSYKGGAPGDGFVKVVSPGQLVFPGYDGNGMFYSMGNIEGQGRVGLLFIDFETPHRLRLQGTARLVRNAATLAQWPEAQYAVHVDVAKVWVNCPRYVHRYARVATSKYVPAEASPAPVAVWKRIDGLQEVLPVGERARAREAGLIGEADYLVRLSRGEA